MTDQELELRAVPKSNGTLQLTTTAGDAPKSYQFPDLQLTATDGTNVGLFGNIIVTIFPDAQDAKQAKLNFKLNIYTQGWFSQYGKLFSITNYDSKLQPLDYWELPVIPITCTDQGTPYFQQKNVARAVYDNVLGPAYEDLNPPGKTKVYKCT